MTSGTFPVLSDAATPKFLTFTTQIKIHHIIMAHILGAALGQPTKRNICLSTNFRTRQNITRNLALEWTLHEVYWNTVKDVINIWDCLRHYDSE